jgi:hypothetical protein
MIKVFISGVALMLLLAGCREKKAPASTGTMSMTMKADSLMPMMRAHLDSLGSIPGRQNADMLARHEQMASRMLDAMGSDMRMMGMRVDSAWQALADSVRRDLAAFPTLSGGALDVRLTAYRARMRRLMDMHAGMMRR